MTTIQLGLTDHRRTVAGALSVPVLNRYFEQTPDPTHGPVSLIARPGLKKFVSIGTGPIRGIYSEPGTFNDDLFAVSGDNLYRVTGAGTTSDLGAIATSGTGNVSMAATPDLGTVPSYLFIAEGGVLYVFTTNGHALGLLEASGAIANSDTVVIDGVYYQFTNGSVDTGTPAGTSGSPWLVNFTGSNAVDMGNLFKAINDSGTEGTDYSTALTAHATVEATAWDANNLYVSARSPGTAGNSIAVSETGANLAWTAANLAGGGSNMLRQVPTPDDVGIVSVDYIAGYVICVCAQGAGVNGRYYWLEPGEITFDALNFATAERAPDPLYSVRVIGDQFWLLGSSSVEPWYLTGQDAAPFARQSARVFDRGVWEGTDLQVKDVVVLVDATDGAVYAVTGNGPQRISTPSIEERIRRAIATQTQQGA